MLIESTTVNSGGDKQALDPQKIARWQCELDQFVANTTTRLEALAIALSNRDAAVQEQATVPHEQAEFVTQAEIAQPIEPPQLQVDTVDEVADAVEEMVHEVAGQVESPSTATIPISNPVEPPADSDDPIDPDEAWARLSAIKSRLAKQLENS